MFPFVFLTMSDGGNMIWIRNSDTRQDLGTTGTDRQTVDGHGGRGDFFDGVFAAPPLFVIWFKNLKKPCFSLLPSSRSCITREKATTEGKGCPAGKRYVETKDSNWSSWPPWQLLRRGRRIASFFVLLPELVSTLCLHLYAIHVRLMSLHVHMAKLNPSKEFKRGEATRGGGRKKRKKKKKKKTPSVASRWSASPNRSWVRKPGTDGVSIGTGRADALPPVGPPTMSSRSALLLPLQQERK
ncbi:hypothetical protein LY76DRAFT_10151 [Colletotrichum caudatum]|nr:hypothetical protein LY76DRAFT_10151 [Colletotrichum caudatum]